jgi:hypothetical protein
MTRKGLWLPVCWRLAVAAVLLTCALEPALTAQQAGGGVRITVIGCITRGSGAGADLVITDFRGGPSPTFRLDPKDSRLEWHVGHTLEVVGTIAGAATGSTPPRLNVQSVNYLSQSCWRPVKQ